MSKKEERAKELTKRARQLEGVRQKAAAARAGIKKTGLGPKGRKHLGATRDLVGVSGTLVRAETALKSSTERYDNALAEMEVRVKALDVAEKALAGAGDDPEPEEG